jgi:hypothetical protein
METTVLEDGIPVAVVEIVVVAAVTSCSRGRNFGRITDGRGLVAANSGIESDRNRFALLGGLQLPA